MPTSAPSPRRALSSSRNYTDAELARFATSFLNIIITGTYCTGMSIDLQNYLAGTWLNEPNRNIDDACYVPQEATRTHLMDSHNFFIAEDYFFGVESAILWFRKAAEDMSACTEIATVVDRVLTKLNTVRAEENYFADMLASYNNDADPVARDNNMGNLRNKASYN